MANPVMYTLEQFGASFHLLVKAILINEGYTEVAANQSGFFVRLNGNNSIILDPEYQHQIVPVGRILERFGCSVDVRYYEDEDGFETHAYMVVNKG